jgi:hypothetical protein
LFTSDPLASKPKEWLVTGVLGAGEISLFLAPPFVGKSSLAGDMAATIGRGEPWFGHPTMKSATLYVAQERSLVMARRLRAFEIYHEVKKLPVALLINRLHMVERSNEAFDLVVSAVKECEDKTGFGVGLITLDTVASLCPGGDENSPRDMGRFIECVARIRDRTGVHVSLVHHTPQDDPRKSRGHTSLPGMVDTVIVLTSKGGRRAWSVSHANDLVEKPPQAGFELHSVTINVSPEGLPTTSPVVVPSGKSAAQTQVRREPTDVRGDAKIGLEIIRRMAATGPIQISEFREALMADKTFQQKSSDARRKAFQTVRETLVDANLIDVTGDVLSIITNEGRLGCEA